VIPATRDKRQKGTETTPIRFWNSEHRAVKGYLGPTHRTCPPEQTLERITPLLPRAGITRMADITGLDRIGVPVALAMRPNAPTLANSSGKGFTRAAAMVSAAMEGIELQFAEDLTGPHGRGQAAVLRATHRELDRDGLVCPFEHLPLARCSTFTADTAEDWLIGFDIIAEQPMAVPYAVVSMAYAYFRDQFRLSFQIGSNGLASGNVFLEAVCAGLAEVIERDAVTCARLRSGGHLELGTEVSLSMVGYDSVADLVDRFRRAGMSPLLFDCTADTAVPTYVAYLSDDLVPDTGIFKGYGTHLHPEVAAVRALTEAAQSRAVYIAGSRDDLMTLEHRRMRLTGGDRVMGPVRGVGAASLPPSSAAAATFEEDCAALVAAVRRAGLNHVIVVDLAPPDLPVSVVRVVVPGLEGYSHFMHYAPGPRGHAALHEASAGPAEWNPFGREATAGERTAR
jgi:ribosomal protein S12 methylthiotransferase accessory factor